MRRDRSFRNNLSEWSFLRSFLLCILLKRIERIRIIVTYIGMLNDMFLFSCHFHEQKSVHKKRGEEYELSWNHICAITGISIWINPMESKKNDERPIRGAEREIWKANCF